MAFSYGRPARGEDQRSSANFLGRCATEISLSFDIQAVVRIGKRLARSIQAVRFAAAIKDSTHRCPLHRLTYHHDEIKST
ncbi:hypothetical protein V1284_001925 [Nitrobacteraceae bacterium AZCC 2299]